MLHHKPIFSVDIHPTGKRFATGGQGGDSGRVVVWNLNSVLYENVELDPNVPKMLCQMDNHLACVNCVRWSNAGRYLASGGDDRLVMVWGLSVVAGGASLGKHKAETWRCIATLRGHAGDVLDLAWSPLDKWLASCSVDNTIIIWNAEKFPEMVCVLNGHTGLVKGVAWDPVGKYLASQSDDKSLRVWKTADWAPEAVITEPFDECGGTTHVLRLSWSPDGQYVVSAHALNGGGPTAQVVERDTWRCDKDFVGHRKAVTCARFNNNILVKEGKKCCCAAVGARDRALSIWLTSLKRPLVVVHDLFADSVLDLSWSADGDYTIHAHTTRVVAGPGAPATARSPSGSRRSSGRSSSCTTCSPTACWTCHGAPTVTIPYTLTQHVLLRGRGRPRPRALHLAHVAQAAARRRARPVRRQRAGPVMERRRPVIPKVVQVDPQGSTGDLLGVYVGVNKKWGSDVKGVHENLSAFDSKETKWLNLLACSSDGTVACIQFTNKEIGTPLTVDEKVINKACNTLYGTLSRLQLLQNNSASTDPIWETYLGSPVTCIACDARYACVSCADGTLHAWRLHRATAKRVLPPIALMSQASKLTLTGDILAAVTTGAELAIWDLAEASCLVKPLCFRGLLAQGVSVTNCSLLEDGNPMIALSNGKSYIYCRKLYAWVVWADCRDPVWRASGGPPAPRALRLAARPRRPAPAPAPAEDRPVLCPTAGQRPPLFSATPPCPGHAPAIELKSAQVVPPSPLGSAPAPMPIPRIPFGYDPNYSAEAARSWLEAQLASCYHLRLARDYRHWLTALFTHLTNHGNEDQLRAILDDMLGPSHCTSTPKKWQSTVLGIKKHDILESMLSVLVRQLRWQRLYSEYSDQLTALKAPLLNGH
ncbi:hypothetical protein MSG28_003133 [Choristoneura fumiferana]|uniref:Uncharacterized protein n=1 Tax=Choristoneura fumiferana TaxID=7141 RepID=A0ACC0KEE5_CHOFU|nr:hypothetical protein MSG28_003133 [Choristoneura fumiferana]